MLRLEPAVLTLYLTHNQSFRPSFRGTDTLVRLGVRDCGLRKLRPQHSGCSITIQE